MKTTKPSIYIGSLEFKWVKSLVDVKNRNFDCYEYRHVDTDGIEHGLDVLIFNSKTQIEGRVYHTNDCLPFVSTYSDSVDKVTKLLTTKLKRILKEELTNKTHKFITEVQEINSILNKL